MIAFRSARVWCVHRTRAANARVRGWSGAVTTRIISRVRSRGRGCVAPLLRVMCVRGCECARLYMVARLSRGGGRGVRGKSSRVVWWARRRQSARVLAIGRCVCMTIGLLTRVGDTRCDWFRLAARGARARCSPSFACATDPICLCACVGICNTAARRNYPNAITHTHTHTHRRATRRARAMRAIHPTPPPTHPYTHTHHPSHPHI